MKKDEKVILRAVREVITEFSLPQIDVWGTIETGNFEAELWEKLAGYGVHSLGEGRPADAYDRAKRLHDEASHRPTKEVKDALEGLAGELAAEIGIKEVTVFVPVRLSVVYTVEVEDPTDLEEIKERLRQKDASHWADDPNLYENLGDEFRRFVEKVTEKDVVVH